MAATSNVVNTIYSARKLKINGTAFSLSAMAYEAIKARQSINFKNVASINAGTNRAVFFSFALTRILCKTVDNTTKNNRTKGIILRKYCDRTVVKTIAETAKIAIVKNRSLM